MKRVLVDFSSLCWTSLFLGKDDEFGTEIEFKGRTLLINSWQHGLENAITFLLNMWEGTGVAPKDTIVVYETGNTTSERKRILPSYKEGRDDNRPQEYYTQFNLLKKELKKTLSPLGVSFVTRPHMEADDVIAYLVEKLQGEKVIMSNDKDMAALLSDEVSLWRNGQLETENPYGPWPAKWVPLYKALVGDPSDKIPGAKGFGEKAWLDLLSMFGLEALEVIQNLIETRNLKELQSNVEDLKALQRVIDNEEDVYRSYEVSKLQPERCESMRRPLEWIHSYVHPRHKIADARLERYGGVVRLVHAGNYDKGFNWIVEQLQKAAYVSLDIETSVPDESIEWLKSVRKTDNEDRLGVDVLASELTGLSLTFGDNNQYTLYFTCDHKETDEIKNLTSKQIMDVVAAIPSTTPIVIHNTAFELPVLYQAWGEDLKDNGWYGFLPNTHDTRILANYVNENMSTGLKQLSKHYFDYDQQEYQDVTQGQKMNELTAEHVLSYGADDTIMTAAHYQHLRLTCELEDSWDVYLEVEVKPAYVTALAFTQGTPISLERMRELEAEDDKVYEEGRKIIDQMLIKLGWEGSVCPTFVEEDLTDPTKLKEMFELVTGKALETRVRRQDKLLEEMEEQCPEHGPLLAHFIREENLSQINDWVQSSFTGKPELNIGSPKQMRDLLYVKLGLPVKIVNSLTERERQTNPKLVDIVSRFSRLQRGDTTVEPLNEDEAKELIQKASTNDVAVQYALREDISDEVREFLEALIKIQTIRTRRNLFYNNYRDLRHWKTGKVHASLHQCGTVTRRYSSSGPNLQQLPKRGEGVKFREIFVPHHENAVICSIDFSGQELRIGADRSKDPNMLACYVGENKRDIHSMVAGAAMKLFWEEAQIEKFRVKYGFDVLTEETEYQLFLKLRQSDDPVERAMAEVLRDRAKDVNFGSAYGAEAPTIAKSLYISVAEAQRLLDARYETFPEYEAWKQRVEDNLRRTGYVTPWRSARRHLANQILSGNKWDVARAERQGANMEIQGAAATQTKLAMAALWDSGALFKYDVVFIAPIHDELVTSVAVEDALEFIKIKHECMTIPFMEDVPEVAEISLGPNFGIQFDCGDKFDEEKVQAALERSLSLKVA